MNARTQERIERPESHRVPLLRSALPSLSREATNALALRAQAGDRWALEELHRRTLRMAGWRLRRIERIYPWLWEDLLASAVGLGTMRALRQWNPVLGSFSTYVLYAFQSYAWRALAELLEQPSRQTRPTVRQTLNVYDLEGSDTEDQDALVDEEYDLERQVADEELSVQLPELLEELPEQVREIAVGRETLRAMAERMGVTYQRIQQIQSKARRWLRSRMEGGHEPHPFKGRGYTKITNAREWTPAQFQSWVRSMCSLRGGHMVLKARARVSHLPASVIKAGRIPRLLNYKLGRVLFALDCQRYPSVIRRICDRPGCIHPAHQREIAR